MIADFHLTDSPPDLFERLNDRRIAWGLVLFLGIGFWDVAFHALQWALHR